MLSFQCSLSQGGQKNTSDVPDPICENADLMSFLCKVHIFSVAMDLKSRSSAGKNVLHSDERLL